METGACVPCDVRVCGVWWGVGGGGGVGGRGGGWVRGGGGGGGVAIPVPGLDFYWKDSP